MCGKSRQLYLNSKKKFKKLTRNGSKVEIGKYKDENIDAKLMNLGLIEDFMN